MTSRTFATVLVGLSLVAVSACGAPAQVSSGGPSPAASTAPDRRTICASVTRASTTALDRLSPLSTTLAGGHVLSAGEIAKATDDLKVALTELHLTISTAIDNTSDPQLKTKLTAYQVSVENAIVAVEGADGDAAKLVAATKLPEMHTAQQGVVEACS